MALHQREKYHVSALGPWRAVLWVRPAFSLLKVLFLDQHPSEISVATGSNSIEVTALSVATGSNSIGVTTLSVAAASNLIGVATLFVATASDLIGVKISVVTVSNSIGVTVSFLQH